MAANSAIYVLEQSEQAVCCMDNDSHSTALFPALMCTGVSKICLLGTLQDLQGRVGKTDIL